MVRKKGETIFSFIDWDFCDRINCEFFDKDKGECLEEYTPDECPKTPRKMD